MPVDLAESHPHGPLVGVVPILAGHVLHGVVAGHLDPARAIDRIKDRLVARLCFSRKKWLAIDAHLHGTAFIDNRYTTLGARRRRL